MAASSLNETLENTHVDMQDLAGSIFEARTEYGRACSAIKNLAEIIEEDPAMDSMGFLLKAVATEMQRIDQEIMDPLDTKLNKAKSIHNQ